MTGLSEDTCFRPPPDEFDTAIAQFNRGQWYACHETLEELWIGETGRKRHLYQGILQVAVALHHWQENNHAGAIFLLEQGVKLLRQVEPVCGTVDVTALIERSDRLRQELTKLGPDHMAELDRTLIPAIKPAATPPDPRA